MARNRNNRNIDQSVAPAQHDDQSVASTQQVANDEVVTDQVTDVTAPVVVPKVAPLPIAKLHNFARSLVSADQDVTAAGVVKTAKGTNPSKARVYGYDNGTQGGGSVPKAATLVVVSGAKSPAGVTADQWTLLQSFAGKSVQVAYDNKVASRSVRRAYRAGAIRFQGV